MATVRKVIVTALPIDEVWDAVRDVGALHTRLVPGFVSGTQLDGEERIVTFGNGMVVREPIVTIDDELRQLVWSAHGGVTTHYSASVDVMRTDDGATRLVWTADFLPEAARPTIEGAMTIGSAVMKRTLDRSVRAVGTAD